MKTLIAHGYLIPVDPNFSVFPDGAVCFEDNTILEVGNSADLLKKYPDAQVEDARGKAILPGLVNAHMHSGLIRGTAEDLPIVEWLAKHVDPAHRILTEEDAYIASKLCYLESLLAGTTTVVDMYRYMHRCADAADETGMRVVLVPYVGDKPGYDYFESIDANEKLFLERNGDADGRIHVWFGMEHLAYCTKDAFHRVASLAEKYDTGIHIHGDESIVVTTKIHQKYGCPPVQVFHNYGILGPKTLLAHCCWITPYEISILRATGTSIAHCPVSNMKLASGVCPVPACLKGDVAVGLGSDGVKENNNLDLFEEMKFASLLQKVHTLDASIMPAMEALKLATIYGAKAIGMDDEIGSLEAGKKADIVLLDLQKLHLAPLLTTGEFANIVTNIVYSASGADVDTVFVNGRRVVQNHQNIGYDLHDVLEAYTAATESLIERRRPFVPDRPSVDDIEV